MVTGGLHIVLLVFSLTATVSSSSLSICQEPAWRIMRKVYTCSTRHMEQLPNFKSMAHTNGPTTKEQVVALAQDYCTIAIPAGIICFQNIIRRCNATVQNKFNEMADTGVGFLCQPGGRGVNPAMSAVLDWFDEDEVRYAVKHDPSEECTVNRTRRSVCYPTSDPRTFSLDEVAPRMQEMGTNMFLCWLDLYRELKDTCPYWRGTFLREIVNIFIWVFLGVNMPLEPEELTEYFEM